MVGPDGVVSRGGAGGGAGGADVRAFAGRQGMDADVRDGDNVMAWGILEGDPEKVSGRVFVPTSVCVVVAGYTFKRGGGCGNVAELRFEIAVFPAR